MKDFFNQELAIGDEVAILLPAYRRLTSAKIIKFTPQKIMVEYISSYTNNLDTTHLYPELCVRTD